jgi:hypothetical protein
MKFCFVGWASRPTHALSRAGGVTHNIGRGKPPVVPVQRETAFPPQGTLLFLGRRRPANSGAWTLSTLWASDWAGLRSDRAGFRMFPREPSVCRVWNAVRVPPRARVFPVQGLVGL